MHVTERNDSNHFVLRLICSIFATMKSLRELYKIGKGPSSSHTMGPQKAAQIFAAHNEGAISFSVTLYGSLAATGKGHMTDVAIEEVLTPLRPPPLCGNPPSFCHSTPTE